MVLRSSIAKTIFLGAFFGFSIAPQDGLGPVALASPVPSGAAPQVLASLAVDETAATNPCGEGMLLVEGDHCPDAEQTCLKWLDPPPYQTLRCGEYAKPAKCKVPRVHRKFCVDRDEFSDPSTGLPVVGKNWGDSKALCETRGARLCKESEWEFACEGEDMSPYPYGWKRDSTLCNFDRTDLGGPEEKLTDHRAPISAFPDCKSPFGVHDMVGNVDEWVERENSVAPFRSSLRGGWWLPGRNRCRAATLAHPENYSGKQVGFRCCKDAP